MPTGGVDVYPERSQSFDYDEYSDALRKTKTSITRGSTAIINSIKIHDRTIAVIFVDEHRKESHFVLHYARIESWMLTPAALIDALNRFVEFSATDKESARLVGSSEYASGYVRRGVVHLGPRSTYLKLGLKTEEVLDLLGEPASVSQRTENGKVVATYEFERGKGKVLIAKFVEDSLVQWRSAEGVVTTLSGS